jgi:Tfp pilus assembly protein PilF/predicted nuclease with TOPRIM domain
MKLFAAAILVWFSLLTVGLAQQDADNRYLLIYEQLQQADGLFQGGQLQEALAAYQAAQSQLQSFQQIYPDWDTDIVSYRLKNVADKIAALKAQLPATTSAGAPAAAPASAANASAPSLGQSAALQSLQQQLQSLKDDNTRLQAKLQEALAMQPQTVDDNALAKANDQILELMKENALLRVSQHPNRSSKSDADFARLQARLDESEKARAEQQARIDKLSDQNRSLQLALDNSGTTNAGFFIRLREENQRLQARLDAMQAGSDQSSAQPAEDNAAVAKLKSAVEVATLEKATLEERLNHVAAETVVTDKRFQATLSRLTAQRDELAKKLKESTPAAAPPQVIEINTSAPVERFVHTNAPPAAVPPSVSSGQAPGNTPTVTSAPIDQTIHTETQPPAVEQPVTTLQVSSSAVPATTPPIATEETVPAQAEPPPASMSIPPPSEIPATQTPPVSTQPTNQPLPAGSSVLVASAQQHFSNHELNLAEGDYRKLLQQAPGNAMILANLATIELDENKLDAAQKHITDALDRSPDDAYNIATAGKIEFARADYDKALQDLNRAAQLDPNNPETQNYLGLTLSHLGQTDAAEAALIKAIKRDPHYAPAHNNLAVVYMSENPPLPQLARWHYQKALEEGQPRNPDLEKLLAGKGAPVSAGN